MQEKKLDFFSNTRPGENVAHGTAKFQIPILYFRDDVFGLLFGADFHKVHTLMPSDKLHPVRLPAGKAIVAIFALNYFETSIGSYGELVVAIPVVHGSRPPLPLIPLLLEACYPGFGFLVALLPVTSLAARDAGRGVWGFTKFTADMDFKQTPELLECRLSEKGSHILTVCVARQGMVLRERKPLITYSVKDGRLIKTIIPQMGAQRLALNPRNSFVCMGAHPVAASIGELGLSAKPFLSRYYIERSGILPKGEVVEEGVRPLEGYYGIDREGTHRTRYMHETEG